MGDIIIRSKIHFNISIYLHIFHVCGMNNEISMNYGEKILIMKEFIVKGYEILILTK